MAGLFAKAIDVLIVAELFGNTKFRSRYGDTARRIVGVQNFPGSIDERNPQGCVLYGDPSEVAITWWCWNRISTFAAADTPRS